MKKFLFILAAAAFFIGCSSDDDNSNSNGGNSDIVVGTWIITSFKVNDFVVELTPCEAEEKIVFNANNSFDEIHFEESGIACQTYDDDFLGNWSATNGTYDITANPDDSFAFFNDATSITTTFSAANAKMNMTLQMPAEGGNEAFQIKLEFNRVP